MITETPHRAPAPPVREEPKDLATWMGHWAGLATGFAAGLSAGSWPVGILVAALTSGLVRRLVLLRHDHRLVRLVAILHEPVAATITMLLVCTIACPWTGLVAALTAGWAVRLLLTAFLVPGGAAVAIDDDLRSLRERT